ncbi:ATP-binding region, ATPase-like protein [Pseudoalteromonas luteoviolacea B = ATCC 29581]|nr:ATP-binding region, ATPase-like protein [Pseudoalteromonas luteoviolacea B = ATCC 29581]
MNELLLLHVVITLCSGVSTVFLWLNWRIHLNLPGTKEWALYGVCLTLANAVLTAQNAVPTAFAIFLANTFTLACSYFFAKGAEAFYGRPVSKSLWFAVSILILPGIFWYSFFEPNIQARLTLNYIASSFSLFIALRALLITTALSRFTIAENSLVFAILVIWSALTARIMMLVDFEATDSVLTPNLANEIFAVAVAIVPLVVGFSMCLLCAARRERTLTTLQEKAHQDADRKSKYLAMLSHELRTPLNAIVGHAHMLKRIPHEPAKHSKLCDTIEQAALSLADLANQVLLQAKGEVAPNKLQVVSLKAMLDPIHHLLKPLAEQKGLQFYYNITSGYQDLNYTIAKEPLQLVLKNLLSNAIKYTQSGEVVLSVTAEQLIGNRVSLTFTVTDTGSGMNDDVLDKIFDPFMSGLETNNISQSAGLGLALCQQLLSGLGAHLEVESSVGEGSCFRFSLECAVSEPHTEPYDLVLPITLTSRTMSQVLVVEDVELNQKVIEHYLGLAQCQYRIASSLSEASRFLTEHSFDIVLLDMHLPDGNGLDWLNEIVPTLSIKSTPKFIALTGDVSSEDRKAYQKAGMVGCLDKPIEPQALFGLIRQVIGTSLTDPSELLDLATVDHWLGLVEDKYIQSKLLYLSDTYDYELAQLQGLADIGAQSALNDKLNHLASESTALGMKVLAEQLYDIEQYDDLSQFNWLRLRQCVKQSIEELTNYCQSAKMKVS